MNSTDRGHDPVYGDALIHAAQPVLPHLPMQAAPELPPSKDPNYDDGLVHDHGWASSSYGRTMAE